MSNNNINDVDSNNNDINNDINDMWNSDTTIEEKVEEGILTSRGYVKPGTPVLPLGNAMKCQIKMAQRDDGDDIIDVIPLAGAQIEARFHKYHDMFPSLGGVWQHGNEHMGSLFVPEGNADRDVYIVQYTKTSNRLRTTWQRGGFTTFIKGAGGRLNDPVRVVWRDNVDIFTYRKHRSNGTWYVEGYLECEAFGGHCDECQATLQGPSEDLKTLDHWVKTGLRHEG